MSGTVTVDTDRGPTGSIDYIYPLPTRLQTGLPSTYSLDTGLHGFPALETRLRLHWSHTEPGPHRRSLLTPEPPLSPSRPPTFCVPPGSLLPTRGDDLPSPVDPSLPWVPSRVLLGRVRGLRVCTSAGSQHPYRRHTLVLHPDVRDSLGLTVQFPLLRLPRIEDTGPEPPPLLPPRRRTTSALLPRPREGGGHSTSSL